MPSDKKLIPFKIGARARKLANEDCVVEGYEILLTAIQEASDKHDSEMESNLKHELERFESRLVPVKNEKNPYGKRGPGRARLPPSLTPTDRQEPRPTSPD